MEPSVQRVLLHPLPETLRSGRDWGREKLDVGDVVIINSDDEN